LGTYLYIDVDAFFASVEQSVNRSLIGRPVMVGGEKHERGVVACPSYEARALGVKTGTPLYEAARLIPNGVFLKGDYNRYEDYSRRFFAVIGDYSSEVDRISQDEACLEIGGTVRHFGSEELLARGLQERIYRELCLSTSIGVAPSRVAAKIASEHKKPYGLTILTHENISEFFAELPIRKIPGIGRVTGRILREMGIRTAGQLGQVPPDYLKSLFGINGLKFASYCRGKDGILLRDYRVVRSVSRETGFAEDITDYGVLTSHLYYLLERGAAKLRSLSRKAGTVTIKFRYGDFQTVEGATRIFPPSNSEQSIYPLVENMFRRLFKRRLGIRLVGVTLSNLKRTTDNETFLNDGIEKERRLLRGLDAVREKGGFFALMTGRTHALTERYKRGDTGFELRTPGLSQ